MEERVLVVGPGAIGALMAARIAGAGTAVAVAVRSPGKAEALRASGVVAVDLQGQEHRASVPVVHDAQGLPWRPTMLIVATRCDQAQAALAAWRDACDPDAALVCVQNGVLGDRLMPLADVRLVMATVGFPATLEGPGRSVQTGPGSLHTGPWPGGSSPHATRAVAVLACVATTHASGNMRGVAWTKLLINSAVTSLGALTGCTMGDMMRDARARRAFVRLFEEGRAVGRAAGVRFEKVSGVHPDLIHRAQRWGLADRLLRFIGRKYERMKSSSLQAVERGQQSEVAYLNGHVVEAAARHGLDAPCHAAVVDLVGAVDAGRLEPSLDLLDRLPSVH